MRLTTGQRAWCESCALLHERPDHRFVGFAQVTSTINGRVLDQGDAVLPGVRITATNANTPT